MPLICTGFPAGVNIDEDLYTADVTTCLVQVASPDACSYNFSYHWPCITDIKEASLGVAGAIRVFMSDDMDDDVYDDYAKHDCAFLPGPRLHLETIPRSA